MYIFFKKTMDVEYHTSTISSPASIFKRSLSEQRFKKWLLVIIIIIILNESESNQT